MLSSVLSFAFCPSSQSPLPLPFFSHQVPSFSLRSSPSLSLSFFFISVVCLRRSHCACLFCPFHILCYTVVMVYLAVYLAMCLSHSCGLLHVPHSEITGHLILILTIGITNSFQISVLLSSRSSFPPPASLFCMARCACRRRRQGVLEGRSTASGKPSSVRASSLFTKVRLVRLLPFALQVSF